MHRKCVFLCSPDSMYRLQPKLTEPAAKEQQNQALSLKTISINSILPLLPCLQKIKKVKLHFLQSYISQCASRALSINDHFLLYLLVKAKTQYIPANRCVQCGCLLFSTSEIATYTDGTNLCQIARNIGKNDHFSA